METKAEINLSLKIPFDLNEKLMREAEKEKRSRHSQIIYSLEKYFDKKLPERGKENEKSTGNFV